jgi:hypothetical protein
MKQAEVLYQELSNGIFKIVDLKNFEIPVNLPEKYFKTYPHMWRIYGGICIASSLETRVSIRVDYELSKIYFNLLIKLMKQCGRNLKKSMEPEVKSINLNRINKDPSIKSIKI